MDTFEKLVALVEAGLRFDRFTEKETLGLVPPHVRLTVRHNGEVKDVSVTMKHWDAKGQTTNSAIHALYDAVFK